MINYIGAFAGIGIEVPMEFGQMCGLFSNTLLSYIVSFSCYQNWQNCQQLHDRLPGLSNPVGLDFMPFINLFQLVVAWYWYSEEQEVLYYMVIVCKDDFLDLFESWDTHVN